MKSQRKTNVKINIEVILLLFIIKYFYNITQYQYYDFKYLKPLL